MYKSIIMWFMSPLRNHKTNPAIDDFIYKLIDLIKSGAKFYATEDGAYIYHVEFEGKKYNLWGDNQYYGYLSRGGQGDWDFNNLWEEEMPSRKCCYDFLQTAKKYLVANKATKDILKDLP